MIDIEEPLRASEFAPEGFDVSKVLKFGVPAPEGSQIASEKALCSLARLS